MHNSQKAYLVYGVSKGLGQAIIHTIAKSTDKIYGISRTAPKNLHNLIWIHTDLSNPIQATTKVKSIIRTKKIDILIYNIGIWDAYSIYSRL